MTPIKSIIINGTSSTYSNIWPPPLVKFKPDINVIQGEDSNGKNT